MSRLALLTRQELMDKNLLEYTQECFKEACSAWSDIRDKNGNIDQALVDYAVRMEERTRNAINELAQQEE